MDKEYHSLAIADRIIEGPLDGGLNLKTETSLVEPHESGKVCQCSAKSVLRYACRRS